MPRASKTYRRFKPLPLPLPRASFAAHERKRLNAICSRPGFAGELELLAGIYQYLLQRGTPKDRDVLATLRDLQAMAKKLRDKLARVDSHTRALLLVAEQEQARATGPDYQRVQWDHVLATFCDLILPRALEKARPRAGRPQALGHHAVADLRKLFREYDVTFSTTDNPHKVTRDTDSAFCLRLVLGLGPTARVDHLLNGK
jgi:hypothetical protein